MEEKEWWAGVVEVMAESLLGIGRPNIDGDP
jgi:hypothetical protein